MAIKRWHSLSMEEVKAFTKSSDLGLSDQDATSRLKRDGLNELPTPKPHSKLRLLYGQFNNPLMYILMATIMISLAIGHVSDAIFIIIVMLANTMVGFYQEYRANDAINSLRKFVVINTRVFRADREKEINSKDLVVGDIVILHGGDKVPADGRILESHGFKINEASLTGESMPVDKRAGKLPPQTVLAERNNMVFMGTLVEEGSAKVLIVATGKQTEMGQIVSLLSATKDSLTPLQIQISKLAKLAGALVLSVIAIIVAIGLWRFDDPVQILLTAISLAVSAVPSGLLPGITLILVLGMHRILREKGLVRKLVANETLGSVTVICTDKTGTLTEGKMKVTHIITAQKELSGKDLEDFHITNPDPKSEAIKKLGRIITLNNDAYIENPGKLPTEWMIHGKITEQALLLSSARMGFDKKTLEQEYLLLDKIYFSSEQKYSATLREFDDGKVELFVIGAPEVLLEHAAPHHKETSEFKKLQDKIDELGRQGLRVLAGAYVEFNSKPKYKHTKELVKNLNLVGLIALEDPIRDEVIDSIKLTKKAGIKTIIVTGDHKLTAQTIAKNIGLPAAADQIIEGQQLEAMTDDELRARISDIIIFVRVSPKHKLRIVEALQANGEIVAMVGDGVNDAPALKTANIGIAVNSGTDTAKEVADLILLDNGFHTIIKAVEQGRIILANIRRVFIYLVVDDFAELFIFIAAMALGLPLPLLPAQILWVNLVQDGFPDMALTTEHESHFAMNHPPRKFGDPIVTKPLRLWLTSVSLLAGLSGFLLFFVGIKLHMDLDKVQTMVFALIGLDSLFFAFCVRSFHKSIFRLDIFNNRWLVWASIASLLLLVAAIELPILQSMLHTRNLSFGEWLCVFGVAVIETAFIELAKKKLVTKDA